MCGAFSSASPACVLRRGYAIFVSIFVNLTSLFGLDSQYDAPRTFFCLLFVGMKFPKVITWCKLLNRVGFSFVNLVLPGLVDIVPNILLTVILQIATNV